jgi:hypothetical protein
MTVLVAPPAYSSTRPFGLWPFGGLADAQPAGLATAASGELFQPSTIECTVDAAGAENVRLDCDSILPNTGGVIVVDPENPRHLVAASGDNDSCCMTFYTSFDRGSTWTAGNTAALASAFGDQPTLTFDARSDGVLQAGFSAVPVPSDGTTDRHVVVSRSDDGGLTWGEPVIVGRGHGASGSRDRTVNVEPSLEADNHPLSPFYGRSYMTWTEFRTDLNVYRSSVIMVAHSDDGGRTWSAPQEISGENATFCTAQISGGPGPCDETGLPIPAVTPNGTIHVVFGNQQHQAAWEPGEFVESQRLAVTSTDGGETWTDPVHVVDLEDSPINPVPGALTDFPLNAFGGSTLTGLQVFVGSGGSMAASPVDGTLYYVFADNRAGVHDSLAPVTDANVYLMTSADGRTWNGPYPVSTSRGDQWFPSVDVNPLTGNLGVLFLDRRQGTKRYNATLATGRPGAFTHERVSTAPSHPNSSRWFAVRDAGVDVPGCNYCTAFIGTSISLAYGADGTAHMVWPDMRDRSFSGGVLPPPIDATDLKFLHLLFTYYANR